MVNIASPPQCVFSTFLKQIIAECDPLDGVTDGLISRPERCNYDTSKLIGQIVNCSDTGGSVEISPQYANVVSRIIEGPRTIDDQFLWFGVPPGAPFSGLANTTAIDGKIVPVPFNSAQAWIEYFLFRNISFNPSELANLTFAQFDESFATSGMAWLILTSRTTAQPYTGIECSKISEIRVWSTTSIGSFLHQVLDIVPRGMARYRQIPSLLWYDGWREARPPRRYLPR